MTDAELAGIRKRAAECLLDPEYVPPPDATDSGPIRGYDRRALLDYIDALQEITWKPGAKIVRTTHD